MKWGESIVVDVKKLLEEYECAVQTLDGQWGDIRAIITDGFAPSKECTDKFFQSIELLRKYYSTMQLAAKEIALAETDDGCSIQTYAELIEQKQQEDANRAKYRGILELFVSVAAVSDIFEKALNPYQQAAAALLEQAEAPSETDVIGPSLFLSCLEMKTLDSPEGEALLEELITLYPAKIYYGITFKKYYLQEDAPANREPSRSGTTQAAGGLEEKKTVQEAILPKASEEEPRKKAVEEVAASTETEPMKSTAKPVALVSAIKPIKSATPAASAFKSDVMHIPAAKTILPLFTRFGALIEPQILAFGVFMDAFKEDETLAKSIHIVLEKLVDKNMLAAYEMGDSGERIYCLTPYCYGCMQKNSVKNSQNLWSIKYGKVSLQAAQEMEAELLTRFQICNSGLLLYLMWARDTQTKSTYRRIRGSIAWQENHYALSVPWKGELLSCSMWTALCEPLPEGNILLVFDAASISEMQINEGNVEFSEEAPTGQPEMLPINGDLFCVQGTVLCRWNGDRWVTEDDVEDRPDVQAPEEPFVPEIALAEEPPESEMAFPQEPPARETVSEVRPGTGGASEQEAVPQSADGAYGISDYDSLTARELAERLLREGQGPDRRQVYQLLLEKLISEGRVCAEGGKVENSITQALVLSKALTLYDQAYLPDHQRLVFALDSRIGERCYRGEQLLSLFEEGAAYPPVLKLMAILRALFAPDTAYDYILRTYARSAFDRYEDSFPNLSLMKGLYNLLLDVSDETAMGFSTQVLRSFIDNDAERDILAQLARDAGDLIQEPRINSGLKAMTPMVARCFGLGSDLRGCMEIIRDGRREERELVYDIYREFLDSSGNLSAQRINAFYEENWQCAIEKIRAPKDIYASQRAKVVEQLQIRLSLIGQWLELTVESGEVSKRLWSQRNDILKELDRVLPLLKRCRPYDRAILHTGLTALRQRLNGQLWKDEEDFADLLRTGVFCLDERGIPCLDADFPVCQYYEPWRNALRHIAAEPEDLHTVLERISDPSDPLIYDNLGQAVDICQYLNARCEEKLLAEQYEADLEASRRSAKDAIEKFMGELESAFAYGRLSEFVKEELRAAVYTIDQTPSALLELFERRHNYGCLRAMLDALRKIIDEKASERQAELKSDIQGRQQSNPSPRLARMLQAALQKLEEPERNFVVAEEYINRFDAGISEDLDVAAASNVFLDFIGPTYGDLYGLCREYSSASLRNFGSDYVERELRRRGVSSQYQNSAQTLLRNMPNRPEDAIPGQIVSMLKELGFDAAQASIVRTVGGGTVVRLSVEVRPDTKDKAEYAHPVDIMGTKLRSPVDVVCLFGRMQPNDIVDKVCSLEMSRTAIVFLNGPLDLPGRRQIAERFHKDKSGRNPFLLIDWVLLLYLALRQRTERLSTLLSCTLPYTSSFQPFVIKGSVSDEMFIGRKRELDQILDPNGPVIVYGGRQLGKTALLERAMSLASHFSKKEFAVLVRAGAMEEPNEEALAKAVAKELNSAGLCIPECSAISALCDCLRQSHSEGRWERLLVLIDEADKMLENFRGLHPAYRPVISLSDLSRNTGNDFKFVFAGLHDVCEAANDPNTVFGQFGTPLIIKPLCASEALELLSRPLRYLGFNINSARLEHLLVNTNFYPGIVHYVGHCLVENLSTSYAKYYSAHDAPPYSLTDKQLGEIMSSDALNERINERIRWTLEVDARYFMLARCIAYLYQEYPEKVKSGYSVDSIIEYAALLDITRLVRLSRPAALTLLKELVDMGILVQPDTESFRFRQQRFLDIIGPRESIERDIQRYIMLANFIADLDGEASETGSGWSVDDIIDQAARRSLTWLTELERSAVLSLLVELVDMGVLTKPHSDVFCLSAKGGTDHA